MTTVISGTKITSPEIEVSGAASAIEPRNTQAGLMCYILPSVSDGWRGIYRSGLDHWARNQQWGGPWGGEMPDAAAGTSHKTEFAVGYIDSNNNVAASIGYNSATDHYSQGFKVPEAATAEAVWLRLYKILNPTDNLTVAIYSDSAGVPGSLITNGTATAQSGKLHTSNNNGEFYRFSFPTPPSLAAGTQYHIVVTRSGATDTSNYWQWIGTTTGNKFPFGGMRQGDTTPTWSGSSVNSQVFLVELSSTGRILQDSGEFDGKLDFGGVGASGTETLSRGLNNAVPLRELMDPTDHTVYGVVKTTVKDRTLFDAGYGEDHDRIVVRCDATTGYASISVYESDGTLTTVTGGIDISTGAVFSLGWRVRAKGDGYDRIDLYVNDTTTSSTGLTLSFDNNFANLGTMYFGGGFALAPTDTQKLSMSALPSAASPAWTWSGTATESAAMSVSGGLLFQGKNGYTSTQTGFYIYSSVSLSNANGHSVRWQKQVLSDPNTKTGYGVTVQIADGSKNHRQTFHEYFSYRDTGTLTPSTQYNLKSAMNTYRMDTKGANGMTYVNRRLVMDDTGNVTSASASNEIYFGDADNGAGENADVVWAYFAYYNTAWNPPQFMTGSIHEFAIWQGDKKALWPLLYNSGTRVSVRELTGIPNNYLDKSEKIPAVHLRSVTFRPTTVATTHTLVAEMEAFVVGSTIDVAYNHSSRNNTAGGVANFIAPVLDGAVEGVGTGAHDDAVYMATTGGYTASKSVRKSYSVPLGLHKVEGRWHNDGGTSTSEFRQLTVGAKP